MINYSKVEVKSRIISIGIANFRSIEYNSFRKPSFYDLDVVVAACAKLMLVRLNNLFYSYPELRLYLIMVQPFANPPDRIIRYKRFWRSIHCPDWFREAAASASSYECEFSDADGIRYAGICEIDLSKLLSAVEETRMDSSSFIIMALPAF